MSHTDELHRRRDFGGDDDGGDGNDGDAAVLTRWWR